MTKQKSIRFLSTLTICLGLLTGCQTTEGGGPSKEVVGTLVGVLVGAALGSQVGDGAGKAAAMFAGAAAGSFWPSRAKPWPRQLVGGDSRRFWASQAAKDLVIDQLGNGGVVTAQRA